MDEIINVVYTKHQNGSFKFPQIKNMCMYLEQLEQLLTISISTENSHICMYIGMTTTYYRPTTDVNNKC